jgi:hypothetical protein
MPGTMGDNAKVLDGCMERRGRGGWGEWGEDAFAKVWMCSENVCGLMFFRVPGLVRVPITLQT